MREFVGFSEGEAKHYIVTLCESVDATPKLNLIEVRVRL